MPRPSEEPDNLTASEIGPPRDSGEGPGTIEQLELQAKHVTYSKTHTDFGSNPIARYQGVAQDLLHSRSELVLRAKLVRAENPD